MARVSKQGHANQFADRLQRIQAGGPNTNGQLMAGVYQNNVSPRGGARSVEKPRRGLVATIILTPIAFIFGAVAMLGGRAFRHHLEKNPDLVPADKADIIMLTADVGAAALLLIILAYLFKLGSGLPRVAMVAGFLAIMLAEGKVLEQSPDQFAMAFSEDYVARMTSRPAPIEGWQEFSEDVASYIPKDMDIETLTARLSGGGRDVMAEASSGGPIFISPSPETEAEMATESAFEDPAVPAD